MYIEELQWLFLLYYGKHKVSLLKHTVLIIMISQRKMLCCTISQAKGLAELVYKYGVTESMPNISHDFSFVRYIAVDKTLDFQG